MADKKISQLPQINALSGSSIIVPLVHDSTTQKMELGAFASYVSQWSAKTGSANTFSGTQTFSGNVNVAGNVNVNGRLTVHEVVANYETASIIFSSGSNKFGDQPSDKHEFTGSTNITGSLYYNDVLVTNIDSNTVFKLQQATQSLNTQTGSQESINSGISAITGAFATELGGIQTTISGHRIEVNGIEAYTASLKGQAIVSSSQQILNYNIFATTGSNTFIGNQNITGSLSISAGEFNVITGSGNMTSSLIFDHTQNDGVTLGLRHNDRLSLADHTFNTQVWAGGVYTQFVRNGTPYSILNVEAFDDNKIYLYRDTRLYNKSLVIDNNLTVQKDVVIGTGSLDMYNGEFSVTSGSGELTSSLSFTHTTVDPITGDATLALRYRNNDVGPENNAWRFVATDNGVQVRYDQYATSNKLLFSVSSFGSNFDKLLIWRDARLFGTGLTIDDSLLVKGVITGSLLSTNGVVSSSNQLFELNVQTGSQQNINSQIGIATSSLNSVSASLIGITNALMGFTASLDNTYATDAQLYQLYQATASIHSATSSLNTQSGSQDFVNRGISSVTGSINLTTASLIGITNGLMAFTAALDNTYATDAQLYQLYQATASIHFTTSSLNTFSGSIRSEVNLLESYTASLKAAAIVSSSTQITNYYKFAETASANTFYGTQTIQGNLQLSSTSPLVYNAGNTNAMLFGFFDGSSIYGPYYQIFGSNYSNTTQRGSAEFVFDSRNGGYSGFNIAEFNGSTWLRKFRVSPSGAEVTGSFVVDGGITGSLNGTADNAKSIDIFTTNTDVDAYPLFANVIGTTGVSVLGDSNLRYNAFSNILTLTGTISATTYLGDIVSSSAQISEIVRLQQATASLNTFTGSIRGEVSGLEAYTASLKAAEIVSSSTQIQNYNVFARTGSANTFYGNQSVTGSILISSGSITMQNRPAFRVVGTSSTDRTGVYTLSGSNFTVDYNEGNHFNNTNGKFTAPIDGLYQVYLNARCGSVNSQQQIIIYKNGPTGTTQLMWETPGNTGVAHFGVSGVIKLAAGDTLEATVSVGSIQFDGNDSWGVTYIG